MSSSSELSWFEWYILGSLFYPIATITAHIRLNNTRMASEIFSVNGLTTAQELFVNNLVYRAPSYVGGNVMMPIGGGFSNEWRCVYTAFRDIHVKKLFWNYELIKQSKKSLQYSVTYISKEAEFSAVVPTAEHNRFPLIFPIRINQYSLPDGPLFFHPKTGLAGLTKKDLLQQALIKTRFFGTVGIPSVALLIFSIRWGFHKLDKYMHPTINNTSPPTNIIEKIQQHLKSWNT